MAKGKPAFKVADIKLAAQGLRKIEWAESRMPLMMELRKLYAKTLPLKGMRIAGCLPRHQGNRRSDPHPESRRGGNRLVGLQPPSPPRTTSPPP